MLINIYRIFNYASIFVVLIFIVLMFTEAVPKSWFIPMVYVGLGLLVLRIVLRIYMNSYMKKLKEGELSSNNQNKQMED